jgi:hypothetical protein
MKYIYVMRPKPLLKIGVSQSPEAKRRQLGYVEVVYAIKSNAATAIEGAVHEALRGRRIDGEWFDVSVENAIKAIDAAAKLHGANPIPQSFRELLWQLQGHQSRENFAVEMKMTYWTVAGWEKKNHIPIRHWNKILDIAAKRGRGDITNELLTNLNEEHKKNKPK